MARACYTDEYLPASFKGVPFEALDTNSEHGRRGAEGEFPFGETTAYADLGIKIRRYPISGRLAENSHIADTSLLIAAVESPGPGILVHPTRGPVMVACTSLRVNDNPDEAQGVTYVDMEFVEANDWVSGFAFLDNLFGLALTPLIDAVSLSFETNYRPDEIRWYNAPDVTRSLSDGFAQIATAYRQATSNSEDQKTWSILSDFKVINDDPFTLRDPAKAITAIKNGMAFVDSASEGEQKLQLFKAIANWAAQSSNFAGEAGIAQDAVFSSIRTLAAGYMVRAIFESPARTVGEALAKYDIVMSIFSEEARISREDCRDPRLFLSLREFIASTQKALLDRAYGLPSLVEYNMSGSVPTLVVAYEIFDDAKRFPEIEVKNPQYLPWAAGPEIVATRV